MYSLSSLLERLPMISQSKLVSSGYGVWVAWNGQLNMAIPQTLSDNGGLNLATEPNQALWFFFSSDAFRALARLQIWARLNPMPVFVQVFPSTLLVDYHLDLSLSVAQELAGQETSVPDEFEVWVHPASQKGVSSIPGLKLAETHTVAGLAKLEWSLLQADSGLDYESALKWFYVIKPLGHPADKNFIEGWRGFFSEIQVLLQRLGLKYISKDNYIIFPIENLRQLKNFCRDVLDLVQAVKMDQERTYWPMVMAAMSQKGLNFNDELPTKFNLDFNRLTPDYPHLRYRTAFLLRDTFLIHEGRYGAGQETVDSWGSISLREEDQEGGASGSLDVYLPSKLVSGPHTECFFCGMKSHTPNDCPTRLIPFWHGDIWSRLADVGIEDIKSGLASLEEGVNRESLVEDMEETLSQENLDSLLLKAMFAVGTICQYRTLKMVWRCRGKEWPGGLSQLVGEEGEFIWGALNYVLANDLEQAEGLLRQATLKYQRSYQPRSLQGFVALEGNDVQQANFYWQEAERQSYTPLQQGYFLFLEARLKEVEGELTDALNLYKQALHLSPKWQEPVYRQGVCMVKMGFAQQGLGIFLDLIERDANFFNRVLVDPELDRGRIHLMQSLFDIWEEAKERAEEEKKQLEKMAGEVGHWFDEGHEFHEEAHNLVSSLVSLSGVDNFVAFKKLAQGSGRLNREIENRVDKEIRVINSRIEQYFEELQDVQKEASWFPFPKLLREFNRDFNYCAEKLNWIKTQHLKIAENFRKTQKFLTEIDSRLRTLRGRLVTLRIVRDSTLFIMVLGKNFLWAELTCLGLALLLIPSLLLLGKYVPDNWLVETLLEQKWEFQKGMVLVLSILALGISAMKTAIQFESKKKQLFDMEEDDELRDEKSSRVGKGRAKARRAAPAKGKAKAKLKAKGKPAKSAAK